MKFNETLSIEEIKSVCHSILQSIEVFEEFGHVCYPPEEKERIEFKAQTIVFDLTQADEKLNELLDDMNTYSSY